MSITFWQEGTRRETRRQPTGQTLCNDNGSKGSNKKQMLIFAVEFRSFFVSVYFILWAAEFPASCHHLSSATFMKRSLLVVEERIFAILNLIQNCLPGRDSYDL